MLNKNTQFGNIDEELLKYIRPAAEEIHLKMKSTLAEKLASVRLNSINVINSVNLDDIQNIDTTSQTNDNTNSASNEKSKVRTIGTRFDNPFTPSAGVEQSQPQPVQNITSGPSAFNDNPNGLYSFIERGGYSGTFILLAAVILLVVTFLVSYMVFVYLGL